MPGAKEQERRFARARSELVAAVRQKGIRDERVLAALGRVRRHRFVDEQDLDVAYIDEALPIGLDQTISQPFTVAYQSEWLDVSPGLRVLEIGTGSGYQAAVLLEMGAEVFSIERHVALHERAESVLRSLGYRPNLRVGDGTEGWPEAAPFDRVLVTAGAEGVPPALLHQLQVPTESHRSGGRLVMPVGDRDSQIMTRYTRTGSDDFLKEEGDVFRFVPLVRDH